MRKSNKLFFGRTRCWTTSMHYSSSWTESFEWSWLCTPSSIYFPEHDMFVGSGCDFHESFEHNSAFSLNFDLDKG